MFVTGMTWMPIPFSILTGIIAELVYWSGGYKSMRSAVLAAGVFPLWSCGNYLPLFLQREQYFAGRTSYGQEYIDAVMKFTPNWMFFALLIAAAIVLTVILIYIFPLIARYANTDIAMIKNYLLAGFRYLFCTIMLFAVHFAMFFLVVAVFTPLIIFGEGLCALLCSYLMINVMRIVAYHADEEQA